MNTDRFILLAGLADDEGETALLHFNERGHRTVRTASLAESEDALQDPNLALVYLRPPADSAGVRELSQVSALRPGLPVIVVQGPATAAGTLEAWHAGARDVLLPPLSPQALDASLARALQSTGVDTEPGDSDGQGRLRYFDEEGTERWATVIAPRFTIGRASSNDLVFSQMNVSRQQAEILVENGEFTLRDLGSKHGTFLNGNRIEAVRLAHGDGIQLGGLQGLKVTFHQADLLQSLLGFSDSKADSGLSIRGFREIGMLLATLRALSSIPLLDDLLGLVLDTAIELTGTERGFIMLKDSNDELQFRCGRNSYKQSLDGSSFQTSRRVPDDVFRTGKRMSINDLEIGDDSVDHTTTRRLGVRSIFCLPLRYLTFHGAGNLSGIGRMETIGVLYVDSQTISGRLSKTQMEGLETLATEAAMAIYNARLYKESQEKRKLEEELAIAREIQQALLPPTSKILPYVEAYSHNIPCREVGGDYLDYFDFEDGRFGFALGDVAGKGMSAALLSSVIQGIFSAQALLDLPPAAIISNVNRNLVRRGMGSRFMTLVFGVLDPDGRCLYTNAGHNPPILLRRDGSLQELTDGGMVVGIFDTAQYESGTVKLEPGDHLVLFTDGVLEARDTQGEEFGEERLRQLLRENVEASAAEILEKLQEAIASFSAGTPQHDDITMMVLGFQGLPPVVPAGSSGTAVPAES